PPRALQVQRYDAWRPPIGSAARGPPAPPGLRSTPRRLATLTRASRLRQRPRRPRRAHLARRRRRSRRRRRGVPPPPRLSSPGRAAFRPPGPPPTPPILPPPPFL